MSEPAGGGGARPAVERRRPGAAQGSGRGLRAPLPPRLGTWARVGCGGGGRGSECRAGAGRRVPSPALRPAPPPRPRPAATTRPRGSSGRDRASHLPPRPARPLFLEPDSAARVGSNPLPGHPAHLPPTSPELCRVLREHLRTHWAAAPGAASAPAGSPQLTSNTRTRLILLWVPPRRRGPVISGSQTRDIPSGPGSLDSTQQSHPSGEDGPRGRDRKKRVSKRKMCALITSGTPLGLNYSGSH